MGIGSRQESLPAQAPARGWACRPALPAREGKGTPALVYDRPEPRLVLDGRLALGRQLPGVLERAVPLRVRSRHLAGRRLARLAPIVAGSVRPRTSARQGLRSAAAVYRDPGGARGGHRDRSLHRLALHGPAAILLSICRPRQL